jgi:regulator of replication initiation timing
MGYLPAEEYGGIMALNKELREQNKRLRAELVNIQVENQKLRMEESFLRESADKAGFELPEEVPQVELQRPCSPQC